MTFSHPTLSELRANGAQAKLWVKEHVNRHHSLRVEAAVARSVAMPVLPRRRRSSSGRSDVWAVGVFRDEADIARACVEHLLEQDIDHVLILDHSSVDGTREVLRQMAGRDPRVHVATDDSPGHFQKERVALLSRAAWRAGAGWVVPVDADEFWFARGTSLGAALRSHTAAVVSATSVNMVPVSSPPDVRDADLAIGPFDGGRPKVSFRSHPLVLLAPGNHGVARVGESAEGLFIAHVPYRSADQMARKFLNGAQALAAARAPSYEGWHWTRGAQLDERQIRRMWDRLVEGEVLPEIAWPGIPVGLRLPALRWPTWDPDGRLPGS